MNDVKDADKVFRQVLRYVPVPKSHIRRQRLDWGRGIE